MLFRFNVSCKLYLPHKTDRFCSDSAGQPLQVSYISYISFMFLIVLLYLRFTDKNIMFSTDSSLCDTVGDLALGTKQPYMQAEHLKTR